MLYNRPPGQINQCMVVIGMVRTITPSVFLPFELAVVLNDYAAITIDDQTNKERSHWKLKIGRQETGTMKRLSLRFLNPVTLAITLAPSERKDKVGISVSRQ